MDNHWSPLLPAIAVPSMPKITFPAEETFSILKERIAERESDLDSDHEMAIICLGAPALHLERFGWDGRYLLWFKGVTAEGAKAEIFQNVAQANVMVIVAKKAGETARRVGFEVPSPPEAPQP